MTDPVPIPGPVRERHAAWTVDLAWQQIPETATWRLRHGDRTHYVKVAPVGWEPGLGAERKRMEWAASRLQVPRVLDSGRAGEFEWLLTDGVPGADATRSEMFGDPAALVPLLARGLRAFHTVPATDCPFDFRLDAAIAHVHRRLDAGLVDRERHLHPEHRHLTLPEVRAELERTRPPDEDLVVCHGDYCLPNVLIDDASVRGYLDLGELGVADRWRDLAVATWSVTWNLGPGWENVFLSAYGVDPDPARTRYYRLLYDLTS